MWPMWERTRWPEMIGSPRAILKEWTRQKAFSCFSMYGKLGGMGVVCLVLLMEEILKAVKGGKFFVEHKLTGASLRESSSFQIPWNLLIAKA